MERLLWDDDEGFRLSKKREYLLVMVLFFLVAVLFTWPLILHIHDGIVGGHGDPLLNTWIVNWDARTIFTHPAQLFQGNIIYPSRDVLAYSEHLLTLGVIAAPVYFIFRDPILSYNFLIFFAFVFSAFGCYLLVKEVTGSRWGGLVAGIFFALCPYKIAQLSHIQMIFSPFLPFMLLYLYRFLKRGGKWNVILFGVFFVVQSLANWHYLIYSAMAAGLLWVWTAIFSRRKDEWMRLGWVVVAMVVATAVIVPFTIPYLKAHSRLPGFERSLKEVELYGAKGQDYLRVLDASVVYGDAPSPFKKGGIGFESVLYPGVTILVLALAGLLLRRRKEDEYLADGGLAFDPATFRQGAIFFLILGMAGALLAFGPKIGGHQNPFYMIPYRMGLLKFTRVPTRFYVLVALALAILGGYGTAKLAVRSYSSRDGGWRTGQLTGLALVAILILEIMTFNLYVYPIPVYGDVPKVYDWLRGQGDVRVVELPTEPLGGANIYDRDLKLNPLNIFDYLYREGDIMYFSTYHWKKIANGYSGYSPFFYRRIITEMQGFPSQRTIDLLQGLDINYVIWDWNWVNPSRLEEYNIRLFSTPGLSLVDDFQNKSVFRVEPSATANPRDMEVSAVAPTAIRPGLGFDFGLLLRNGSGKPMVCTEEEPQGFTLTFSDDAGKAVLATKGTYRPPFFIDKGETISLSLQAEKSPPAGSYTARLQLDGGVLGQHNFDLPLDVREAPDSGGPGTMSGNVAAPGRPLEVPSPDGLYPLMVANVTNTGDTSWLSRLQREDYSLPPGTVHLGLRWLEMDGSVWEDQGCTIPCDVAPGQSVPVPLLVRPPNVPGIYRLDVGLYHEGSGYFGDMLQLNVEVRAASE